MTPVYQYVPPVRVIENKKVIWFYIRKIDHYTYFERTICSVLCFWDVQ